MTLKPGSYVTTVARVSRWFYEVFTSIFLKTQKCDWLWQYENMSRMRFSPKAISIPMMYKCYLNIFCFSNTNVQTFLTETRLHIYNVIKGWIFVTFYSSNNLKRNLAKHHIRMISEGSCDTEEWSNDAENTALTTGINYTLQYIQIEI